MKKFYFKSIVALAFLGLGTMNVAAQEEEENDLPVLPVKMTYVSGTDADVDIAYGECDTIKAGWNLGNSVAVGGTIGFGNKGWGANWIGVLKVDGTAIPGTITKATLKAQVSGSLDSKRNTGWGVALTDNEWSADLTYSTVGAWTVSAILNGGEQVWTNSKSATGFEEISLDVTDAFAGGKSTATLLVYEGIKSGNAGAAGGFMTDVRVEVEYDPYEATETTFDFEDGNKVFTDDSRITSAIETDETLGSKVLGWTCADNAQNGYCFSHYNFADKLNNPALVKIEFDYYNTKGGRAILNIGDGQVRGTTGGSTKVTYNKTGVIFQIGSDKNNAFINGINIGQDNVTTTYKVFDEELGDSVEVSETQLGLCDRWMHVTLIANNDAKTVTWFVDDKETGDNIHYGTSAFFADDANACTQIDLFGYINKSHCAMLDNLTITNYKSNAVFADYTVRYIDAAENVLKESRTGNGQVGKNVKLLEADKASFYNEDNTKKYIYDADNSETEVIAESGTVITIMFREAEVYNAVLNCMIEGTSGTANRLAMIQGTFFEGDNYYVYPSRGYGKDGKYYFTPAASYNGVSFAFPGSISPASQNGKKYYIGTLYYSEVDSVAYYSDIERLALPTTDEGFGKGLGQLVGSVAAPAAGKGAAEPWYSFSGGYFDRFSGGRGVRLAEGSYVYTEPIAEAGTYLVTIYGRNDKSAAAEAPYVLGLVQADGSVLDYQDLVAPTWGSATTGSNIVEGVAIPAGGKLAIINRGNGTFISLDDISLTKTGEYVEPNLVNAIQEAKVAVANSAIYTISGQRLSAAPAKGLYIQNGKKFVVK